MSKKTLVILIVIVVALVLAAVLLSGPAEAPSTETPTSQVPAPGFEDVPEAVVNTGGMEVVYTDAGFSPSTLTVQAGDTVTFSNQSSVDFWPASAAHPTHAVYSGTSLSEHCPDGSEAFDACAGISPGESWPFTFNKVGTWRYHDHLNPSRTGTIVVE
jgi:plastocyanin